MNTINHAVEIPLSLTREEFDDLIAAIEAYGAAYYDWGVDDILRRSLPTDGPHSRATKIRTARMAWSTRLNATLLEGNSEAFLASHREVLELCRRIDDWAETRQECGSIGVKVIRDSNRVDDLADIDTTTIDSDLLQQMARTHDAEQVARLKWSAPIARMYLQPLDQLPEWITCLATGDRDAMTPEMRHAYDTAMYPPICD